MRTTKYLLGIVIALASPVFLTIVVSKVYLQQFFGNEQWWILAAVSAVLLLTSGAAGYAIAVYLYKRLITDVTPVQKTLARIKRETGL